METKEYRTVDKSKWPRGPWDAEPDKVQWQDPATGLPCIITRNCFGALCGYAGVPPWHPLHRVEYEDAGLRAHGGVNYSAFCQPAEDEARAVCHVAAPGEPEDVWWFGFDCSHGRDASPAAGFMDACTYRDIAYVRAQVAALAAQLKAKETNRGA